ncbi:MAG: TIGR03016 family PEP-CTERM system-associated outer membrane protein [Proteobacteria bacterium]|nr:TIGR03016 family PEP-CTERM system-associated outer membrane protein [Pseudomonadota bacterium]
MTAWRVRAAGGLPWAALLVLAAGGVPAHAQFGSALGVGAAEGAAGAGGLGGFGEGGGGGGSGGTPPFYITTGLGASLTATNNVSLSSNDSQSSLILTATPYIQAFGQRGWLRGSLSYALSASVYSGGDQRTTFNNSLSAQGTAELIRSRMYVDATASISRQMISPFGTQSPSPIFNNANSTQVSTVSVAPRLNGQIAGQVDYSARAFYSYSSSGTSLASDSSTFGAIASFNGSTRWSNLGWGLNFSYREVRFSQGRNEFDQLNWVALHYSGIPDVVLTARANQETSNITSLNNETHYGYGGGIRWAPSPRTDFTVQYDTRVFGSSHLYAFNYRAPRSVWSISSTQGLSTGQGGGFGGGGFYGGSVPANTTAYQLLFAAFASIQPDPVLRAQLVNNFLRANGIDPNATIAPSYLPNQVTEQLSNQASVAWLGKRDTAMLSVNQTRSTRLGPLSNPGNDFANGQPITWLGFSGTWSHRLTPRSNLTATLSQQQTSGAADSTFRTANLMWSSQVAERASAALMGSYSVQRGSGGYDMFSITATFNIQF